MNEKQFNWLATVVIVVIALLFGLFSGKCSGTNSSTSTEQYKDSIGVENSVDIPESDSVAIDITSLDMSKDNFFLVCEYFMVKFPEVVYSQALLESGHFTSKHYRERNNFLGLYDSKRKRYMSFSHWTDCLIAYRDKVQYRYIRNLDMEDYISWLAEIGYAEDPEYISKIKKMLRK